LALLVQNLPKYGRQAAPQPSLQVIADAAQGAKNRNAIAGSRT
jgi:hypothetical protein